MYPGRQPKVNVSRFLFLCRARSSSMKQRWRCIHARTNKTNAYFFRWSMVIMSTTQRGALCRESACSRSNHQRNDIISPKFHTKLRDVRRSTRARSEAVDRSRCDYLSQRCGSASRRLTAQRARNLRSNQPVARRASFTSIEARRLRPAVHRGALDSRVEMTDKISFRIAQASGVREARPSTRKRA